MHLAIRRSFDKRLAHDTKGRRPFLNKRILGTLTRPIRTPLSLLLDKFMILLSGYQTHCAFIYNTRHLRDCKLSRSL